VLSTCAGMILSITARTILAARDAEGVLFPRSTRVPAPAPPCPSAWPKGDFVLNSPLKVEPRGRKGWRGSTRRARMRASPGRALRRFQPCSVLVIGRIRRRPESSGKPWRGGPQRHEAADGGAVRASGPPPGPGPLDLFGSR